MTSHATAPPAIRTHGLRKSYGPHDAVAGLDLVVPAGRVFGFLGPNGAGKTTTLKLLVGLVAPTSGTAELFGRDVRENPFELRRRIGFLAQEPRFYPYLSARETLALVARLYGLGSTRAEARRIDASLDEVGLSELADRRVGGFSGGERQRLGIAQASLHQPELLILDEPAASLDPLGRRDVLDLIRRLQGRATVFFSTHILEDVQRVADEAAILARGRLRAQGRMDELLAGDGDAVTVELRGADETLLDELRSAPWVASVDATTEDDLQRWTVRLNAPEGDRALLRFLADTETVSVASFRRASSSLEDVFVRVIEREDARDAA